MNWLPHFRATVLQGPPDPWPMTVQITQWSMNNMQLRLSPAAGRSICPDGVKCAPAVIVPSALPATGEEVNAVPRNHIRV